MSQEKKIRYAVVGAGWISQAAFMPAVKHTGNSEMTALVTGDVLKAKELAQIYGISKTYTYEQYDEMLKSGEVDAVYLALPNDMHTDYSVRTLEAGIHLLLEKPMAPTEAECQAMIDASKKGGAKLMVAYRLHFEPGNLKVIDLVKSGQIGDARLFTAILCQDLSADNHRANPKHWAGPLQDLGAYPINAARFIFQDEPLDVLGEKIEASPTDSLISVMMRFSRSRVAQFTVGVGENRIDQYRIVGKKGDIEMLKGFGFGETMEQIINVGGKKERVQVPETDQFGGELKYFSDCILENKNPEPDGSEGLADIRVIKAIERSIASGRIEKLERYEKAERPGLRQAERLSPIEVPKMVNAAKPG
jgi:predicted dehydrogenase